MMECSSVVNHQRERELNELCQRTCITYFNDTGVQINTPFVLAMIVSTRNSRSRVPGWKNVSTANSDERKTNCMLMENIKERQLPTQRSAKWPMPTLCPRHQATRPEQPHSNTPMSSTTTGIWSATTALEQSSRQRPRFEIRGGNSHVASCNFQLKNRQPRTQIPWTSACRTWSQSSECGHQRAEDGLNHRGQTLQKKCSFTRAETD